MDFGQFYLEKLNNVIAELYKEKVTLQCQLEYMIKKHETLEQEFKETSEKFEEKQNNLSLAEKEIEKLKKKLNKNQVISEKENNKSSEYLNNGESKEIKEEKTE